MTINTPSSKCILVMAGGTGGHIFPGLAVAEYLRLEGWRVHWLGNPNGMEFELIQKYGFTFEAVRFGGLRGKGWKVKLGLPMHLMRAMVQSRKIIQRIKPSVILGMGGYVTFPAGIVGALKGVPLVLHEQNSIAGLANKVLAKFAKRVLCAFPNAIAKAQWVGNPLRANLLQLPSPAARFANRSGVLNVLVVGGSLGAQALNDIVPKAIRLIESEKRPKIVHQAGVKHLETLQQAYAQAQVSAQVLAFIDDMAQAYGNADVVICRAGAMTIAELAACGVPSILVPFPYAVDDHQTSNAKFLADAGAAKLVDQKNLTPEYLAKWLSDLTRSTLQEMAEKALHLAKPFATMQVAQTCKEVSLP